MTDIDALIYECRALTNSGFGLCRSRAIDLLAALTTERAKVAALEAEVERLKTENHYAYGGRPCDAKGGCLDRSTCGDCSEPGAIELEQAEAARWREVAGDLAGAVEQAQGIFAHCDVTSGCCMCGSPVASHSRVDGHGPVDQGEYSVDQWRPRADVALTRFKQESGQ